MTGEEPDPQYHWEETMIHFVLEVILLSMANTTTISKTLYKYLHWHVIHHQLSYILSFSDPVTPMNQGRDPTVSSALLAAE